MKRVACYVRVSTAEQNEASQVREIKRWLAGNGVAPDHAVWYVDKSTGDNLQRPEYERLQKDVFVGKVATVVVWKLDRLSRSMKDGINVLADWCDRGLRVVSVTQQIDFAGTMDRTSRSVHLPLSTDHAQSGGLFSIHECALWPVLT